ncbi:MAG: hypothetical protein ACJ79J_02060, partial [Gemmatimonadaceae bacterium]
RNHQGTLVGFAKVTRDLTSRRDAEEQARQLVAEQAARAEAARRNAELVRSGKIRLVTYQQMVQRTGLSGMKRPANTDNP